MPSSLAPDTTALLDALPDAALVVDRGGVIVFANRQAGALLGGAHAELAGTGLERWLAGCTSGCVEARRADGTAVPVEVRRAPLGETTSALSVITLRDRSEYARLVDAARDAEDRYRMVVTSASEVFDRVRMSHDAMRGIVDFVSPQCERDRQRLGEELRQAQKMEAIGRLASGVAHDFNNLVTVILASCDAARAEGGASAEVVKASLDEIVDAGNRASELTKKLLTVSHEQPSAPRVLDLNAHLRASQLLILRMLPDTVDLQWALDEGAWPVLLDESHLDQVLFNLVANARDAMSGGGRLTVGTSNVTCLDEPLTGVAGLPIGDYVRMTVTDTGAGMDATTIAHAFEPFYTTKPQGKGTGLGLASVYGIVKQARGDIHIESEPDLGTRVVIHFPRVTRA